MAHVVDPVINSVSDIERALAFVLRYGNLPRARERLIARAGVPIELAGYAVLSRIATTGEGRLSELAGQLGVDASTLSRQVKHLVQIGYLARTNDPADGRASILRPTRRGRNAVERIRVARLAVLEELTSDWTAEERKCFAHLLLRFADALMDMAVR
jgi:DNA-binding MarR family transcriptional regulator